MYSDDDLINSIRAKKKPVEVPTEPLEIPDESDALEEPLDMPEAPTETEADRLRTRIKAILG